ncbi:hypothetical protein MIR68_011900 [Amoeboaphelidium protococcarum]|nr:hypothetical protein MIR68_011900 [Amoeboaphelidium protococcarum]
MDDYEYSTVDSIPGCFVQDDEVVHLTVEEVEEMCVGFSDGESDDESIYADIGLNHGYVDQSSESRDLLDQERENNLVKHTFDEADLGESLKRLGCQQTCP